MRVWLPVNVWTCFFSDRFGLLILAACLTLTVAAAAPASTRLRAGAIAATTETQFLKENQAAMDKMMAGMVVQPSGDIDRDFVRLMVAHHQGAIDMAMAVLRYGHNEQIRRLAQEIIIDQQQEITAMRAAVAEAVAHSAASGNSTSETP